MMRISNTRTLGLLLVPLIATGVSAQRPDTGSDKGSDKGVTRLQLEATLLGGARAAESIEINGKIRNLAELRARVLDEGTVVGDSARMILETLVMEVLRDELVRRSSWLEDAASRWYWSRSRATCASGGPRGPLWRQPSSRHSAPFGPRHWRPARDTWPPENTNRRSCN